MWCEEAIRSVWNTVVTHNLKIFSWYILFFVLNKKLCMPSWNLLLFKHVLYSCTSVRCVLMYSLYVCSVYIGVGITLQKSSVYQYTAKNIGVPSCLATHVWRICFHLWAFAVTTLHAHVIYACVQRYNTKTGCWND
jgi:hypothetical protein